MAKISGSERVGIQLAILATLFWSCAFLSARYLLGEAQRIDPMSLVFYRFVIGSAVILAFAAWRKESLRFRSFREFREMLFVAFFLFFLMSLLFFIGQRNASATTSALFIESGPALLVIIWKLIRRHPTGKAELFAVGSGALGCMLVLNIISADGIRYGIADWLGQLALLGAAISWVIGSVGGQELMRVPNRIALMGYCEAFAALMMVPAMFCFRSKLIVPQGAGPWGAVILMGLVPTAFAFIAWSVAMPRLALWKLSLIQNLTPVFTLIGAWLFLGENPTILNMLGIMLVLAGLSFATLRKVD